MMDCSRIKISKVTSLTFDVHFITFSLILISAVVSLDQLKVVLETEMDIVKPFSAFLLAIIMPWLISASKGFFILSYRSTVSLYLYDQFIIIMETANYARL